MKKVVMDKFKHFIIYLISFGLNYLIFIMLMIFFNKDNIIAINIVNLIAWIVSMLFIFYVDKNLHTTTYPITNGSHCQQNIDNNRRKLLRNM